MLNLQIIYRKYHFIGTFKQEGIVASHCVLVFIVCHLQNYLNVDIMLTLTGLV